MRAFFLSALVAITVSFVGGISQADPQFWKWEWPNTNFEKSAVPWIEIESGGPPKDGIPAIDNPQFHPVSQEEKLAPNEPVMTVEFNGIARAYPIRYLMWHEIVNDDFNGHPVTVTYCPLCNSGIVFDGMVDGKAFDFGVSGKLRNSDMVMYDRQTESWWQQFTGVGIVGDMLGVELSKLPGWMEPWSAFAARNPEAQVMSEPNFLRQYGRNPYVSYDGSFKPFLYRGENPPHDIRPLARVVVVDQRAWPLERLAAAGVIEEDGLRIEWQAGMASALDRGMIAEGRDIGSIRVKDEAGRDLAHDVAFAFAFHAFYPDGEWMLGN